MSNELDTTTPAAPAPEPIQTDTVKSLVSWASEMSAANSIAKAVCNTMFAPAHFRGKPDEATAAILYGYTLDMPPMVSLKTIYVVHGTPALYAQQMFAIALSKGHEIERVSFDEERVEFRCRRRGTLTWQTVEWTIQRAQRAGYTSNQKYRENPIGMLTEKCKAEAAKLVAPDALAGMASVEEIQLGDFEDLGEPIKPTLEAPGEGASSVRRAMAAAKATPEPAPEPAPEPEPAAPAAATTAQLTKVNILLEELGQTDRAAKLLFLTDWTGRTITSSKDLTKDEAHRFIDENTNTIPANVTHDGELIEEMSN